MFSKNPVREFPVEYMAYDKSWHRLLCVNHIDLDGAAAWAERRLRTVKAAGVPMPIRPVLRVVCPVTGHERSLAAQAAFYHCTAAADYAEKEVQRG